MLHRENYILNRFNTLCPLDNPNRVSKNFKILNGAKEETSERTAEERFFSLARVAVHRVAARRRCVVRTRGGGDAKVQKHVRSETRSRTAKIQRLQSIQRRDGGNQILMVMLQLL